MTAPTWDIRQGDALTLLRAMPAESVHCLVTSPPYWNLRAYHAGPQEIGSEPTLEAYLTGLVAVFHEAKRVLHRTGVAWVNLGDSYMGSGGPGGDYRDGKGGDIYGRQYLRRAEGLQSGDLCRIPDRVATALQQDGWLLRDCIVWAKATPMPESVRGWRWERHRVNEGHRPLRGDTRTMGGAGGLSSLDPSRTNALWSDCPGCPKCTPNDGLVLRKGSWRTTRSHEYVFLLARGPGYFADGEDVKTQYARLWGSDNGGTFSHPVSRAEHGITGYFHSGGYPVPSTGANARSVWEIGREPLTGEFAGQHFAAYPTELPERCIKAGTSAAGCCPRCLMPWARVVESTGHVNGREPAHVPNNSPTKTDSTGWGPTSKATSVFRPTCACGEPEPIPCTVLDPFSGTGSTGIAAIRTGRSYTGLELSAKYVELSKHRLSVEAPRANSVALARELGREIQLPMDG